MKALEHEVKGFDLRFHRVVSQTLHKTTQSRPLTRAICALRCGAPHSRAQTVRMRTHAREYEPRMYVRTSVCTNESMHARARAHACACICALGVV